jgi:hypothetical protein
VGGLCLGFVINKLEPPEGGPLGGGLTDLGKLPEVGVVGGEAKVLIGLGMFAVGEVAAIRFPIFDISRPGLF